MNIRDYCFFYARDGLFLPHGSYKVEEISPQQMELLLEKENKNFLSSQNHSYPSHDNHKILK